MADEAKAPEVEEKKLAVIVDQDGVLLRLEMGDQELEESKDYELYEETVAKAPVEAPVAPEAPKSELSSLSSGDEVTFTAAAAAYYGAPGGILLETLPGGAEVKVQVNGVDQTMGVESLA